MAHKTYQFTW